MLKIEIGEPIVIFGGILGCFSLLILVIGSYEMLDRYLTHLEPAPPKIETAP